MQSPVAIFFFILLFVGGFLFYVFAGVPSCNCAPGTSMLSAMLQGKETFAMPPQPYRGDQGRLSLASSSCPDVLRVTRGGVSAFRTYEDTSITNPHVFPSMDEYLAYAESMNDLYGCPILNPVQDIPESAYLPRPVPVVPTYAINPSVATTRPRGIDPVGYYDWDYTITDEKNRARQEDQVFSDMPGDSNWGGPMYSEYIIASGKHAGSTVVRNRPIIKYPISM